MSDGHIMRNQGNGWKLWRKLKPGIDAREYAHKFNERTKAIPLELRLYIEALMDACDLEHRLRLHTAISLMPGDPDGVWAECDDYGYSYDIEDIVRACRLYRAAEEALKPNGTSEESR